MTKQMLRLYQEAESTTSTSTPATSQTPAATEPVVVADTGNTASEETSKVDWAELDFHEEEDSGDLSRNEDEPLTPPVTPVVPAPSTPATPTPPTTPTLTPAASTTPTPTPAVAEIPPTTPVAVVPPTQTAEERNAAEATQMAELRRGLEEAYKLPDEDLAALATEPELVLPKIAARIHEKLALNFQTAMQAMLPGMIHQVQQMQTQETQAKDAFFGAWPVLKAHEEHALRVAKLFRQANPDVKGPDAIKRIGEMTCLALGLSIPGTTATPTPSPTPTPTPAGTVFRPAGGAGGGRGAPPESDNIFTQMANEIEADS